MAIVLAGAPGLSGLRAGLDDLCAPGRPASGGDRQVGPCPDPLPAAVILSRGDDGMPSTLWRAGGAKGPCFAPAALRPGDAPAVLPGGSVSLPACHPGPGDSLLARHCLLTV